MFDPTSRSGSEYRYLLCWLYVYERIVVVVVFISAYNENNSIINEQQSHCMPGLPEGNANPTSWPPVLTILCQLAVQRKEN